MSQIQTIPNDKRAAFGLVTDIMDSVNPVNLQIFIITRGGISSVALYISSLLSCLLLPPGIVKLSQRTVAAEAIFHRRNSSHSTISIAFPIFQLQHCGQSAFPVRCGAADLRISSCSGQAGPINRRNGPNFLLKANQSSSYQTRLDFHCVYVLEYSVGFFPKTYAYLQTTTSPATVYLLPVSHS